MAIENQQQSGEMSGGEATGLEAVKGILGDAGIIDEPKQDSPESGAKPAKAGERGGGSAEAGGASGDDGAPGDPLADIDTSDLGVAPPPPKKDAPPANLAEAAEALGLTVEQMYELQIPMRDGVEPVTLGAMKDLASKTDSLDADSAALDERRTTFENQMIRQQQELNEVVALLPKVPDALIEQARNAYQANIDRERAALLTIKPEWRDDKVYALAQEGILAAVSDYGFTRSDLDLVIDHRLTKLLHDFANLKSRIAKANAAAKEVKPGQQRGGQKVSDRKQRQQREAAATENAKGGTQQQQVTAVNEILRNNL